MTSRRDEPDATPRDASAPRGAASTPWSPSGVIALLTDFGLEDPYVGQMHAVLAAHAPSARVIDLSHGVPPQDVEVGAFQLARSAEYFPHGSVLVAVVDPEVGSARRILVATAGGRAFLAPDNGLLPAALGESARYVELDVERFSLPGRSATFHGRDVFAPAAARIASGTDPLACGRALATPPRALVARSASRVSDSRVEARVLFADRYGNLVLDATPADLAGSPERWRAEVKTRSIAFAGTYADVPPGELLLLVDSFGALEIARRDGSARDALGLDRGASVVLTRVS
jgi:S-adenosyl-L-methionine hydrolase (adenosine-forming)